MSKEKLYANRRDAREHALFSLFQIFIGQNSLEDALDYTKNYTEQYFAFSEVLVYGVINNLAKIDLILQTNLKKWRLDRLGNVEKNTMRLAVFELCFNEEKLDVAIILNEAIEIVKKYSDDKSAKFVNSILHTIATGDACST